MTNPVFGYQSHYRDGGTVTSSTSPAATPRDNATDWRFDDYWQPTAGTSHWLEVDAGSAVSADYFAFYSSDLYAQAGAQVQLTAGAAPAPAAVQGTINPTTAGPKLLRFTSASFRYWRLTFSTTGSFAPKIQIANVGAQLELEQGARPGFVPPKLAPANKPQTNISEQGFFIGRSLKLAPADFRLPTTILTPAWVRANWPALLAHIESYPFFLLPEPDTYADEAVIAWTKGAISAPRYSHAQFMSLDLNLTALI